jgi:transcriptional regulator GlxA family with amidase domain
VRRNRDDVVHLRDPTQNRAPQSIGFLLLDNFTLISLASAVEPLRMANQLSGRELYRWHTLTVDGGQVWASDGLQITPDASMHKAPPMDTVIVCGGWHPAHRYP